MNLKRIPWWVWAIAAVVDIFVADPIPFIDEIALIAMAIWSYR